MGLFSKKKQVPIFSGGSQDEELEQLNTTGRVMRRSVNEVVQANKEADDYEEIGMREDHAVPEKSSRKSGSRNKRGSRTSANKAKIRNKRENEEQQSDPKVISSTNSIKEKKGSLILNSALPAMFANSELTCQYNEDLSYTKWVLESAADLDLDPIVNIPSSVRKDSSYLVAKINENLHTNSIKNEVNAEPEADVVQVVDKMSSTKSDEVVVEVL